MKLFRLFLLMLICIGIGALITQKIWVPKVVARILSAEHTDQIVPLTQPTSLLTDGRYCYTYTHDATSAEPYTVQEFIDMTVVGNHLSGTKRGTQNGPDMTNGYTGTMVGTVGATTLTDVFAYTIEGSKNSEQEIYRIRPDQIGIEKLRYPLVESNGILVPDMTQSFSPMLYARVGCTASN